MKKLFMLAVAGVAIKLFLDSPQGHQIIRKVQGALQDVQDRINEWLEETADKIENTAERVDKTVAEKIAT